MIQFVPLLSRDTFVFHELVIQSIHSAEPRTCLIDGAEVVRLEMTADICAFNHHRLDLRDVATSGKSATRTTPLAG